VILYVKMHENEYLRAFDAILLRRGEKKSSFGSKNGPLGTDVSELKIEREVFFHAWMTHYFVGYAEI